MEKVGPVGKDIVEGYGVVVDFVLDNPPAIDVGRVTKVVGSEGRYGVRVEGLGNT